MLRAILVILTFDINTSTHDIKSPTFDINTSTLDGKSPTFDIESRAFDAKRWHSKGNTVLILRPKTLLLLLDTLRSAFPSDNARHRR